MGMRKGNKYLFLKLFVLEDTIRPAVFIVQDFEVFPSDIGIIPDGFKDSFFSGEAGGIVLDRIFMRFGILDLFFMENVL